MGKSSKMNVLFNSINVNVIAANSGIFVGSNTQLYWNTVNKMNSGAGNVVGSKNFSTGNINVVYDNDLVDTYTKILEDGDDDDENGNSDESGNGNTNGKCTSSNGVKNS